MLGKVKPTQVTTVHLNPFIVNFSWTLPVVESAALERACAAFAIRPGQFARNGWGDEIPQGMDGARIDGGGRSGARPGARLSAPRSECHQARFRGRHRHYPLL